MKNWLFGLIAVLILIVGCNKNNPLTPPDPVPVISYVLAPDTLYTTLSSSHYMMVDVTDAQGIDDIQSVTCQLADASGAVLATLTLSDDGQYGDIIPADGTFTVQLNAVVAQLSAGEIYLHIQAQDKAGHTSETATTTLILISGEENTPPSISELSAPVSISFKQSTEYLFTVLAKDPQGLDDLALVRLDFFSPTSPSPVFRDTLNDAGENGDQISGDGRFSTVLSIGAFQNLTPGLYTIRVLAFDRAGARSNPLLRTVQFVREGNDPPVIFNLIAPDTMQLPPRGAVQSTLSVAASDPQGLGDIQQVFFNSYKPDGSPSSGNPFFMADDGNISVSGDETAGDGVYSLTINLPSGTTPGDYRFVFEAVDKSDAHSNKITHIITVK